MNVVLIAFTGALLAALGWSQPAVAFHITGFSGTVVSIDSVARQVNISITETTVGTGSPHVAANVQWGDAMTSLQAWTSTTGVAPKIYKVSASHTYPDLTTRMITLFSDSNAPSPLQDTLQVDFGCSDTPLGGCRAAGKSLLQIKNDSDDGKDKFVWKWVKGADTSLAALGDPTSSTQYFVCVYDAPGPALALQAVVPAGAPEWSAAGSSGFKYKDNTGAAGGMTKIKLKAATGGKAKVLVKGAGADLEDPLPLTQPVTVQLQNSDGECWEHPFTSPETETSADAFKDKEP